MHRARRFSGFIMIKKWTDDRKNGSNAFPKQSIQIRYFRRNDRYFWRPTVGADVKNVSVKNCGDSDCKWCHWPSFDSINAYLFYHQFYIDTDGNGGVGCRSLNLIPKGFRSIWTELFCVTFLWFFVSGAVTTIASSPSTRNTCTQIHLPLNMRARLSSRFTLTEINAGVCASCSYWHLLSRNEMTTLISYWFYQRLPLDSHRRHEKERPKQNGWHAEMDRNEKQIVDDGEHEETINIGCVQSTLWQ